MVSKGMEVKTLNLVHEGGTKRYKLCLVLSVDKRRSVLVKRWGKVGTHGESKIHQGSNHQGETLYHETIKAKLKRGYEDKDDGQITKHFDDHAELLRWLARETNGETARTIMSFLVPEEFGDQAVRFEVDNEIVEETPPPPLAVDRSGDENWASW